jgi:hypothetical protein
MDVDRIREDARRTSTENLLDRVTIYRGEMEPAAIDVLRSELEARGVSSAAIEAHAVLREKAGLSRHPDGTVVRCSFCPRPAIAHRRQWYRLWGWFLPLFPKVVHLCKEHEEQSLLDPHGRPLHYDVQQGERRDGSTE